MPPTPPIWPQQPAPPQRPPGGGLGTAAMVLGILSIVLLFLCGLGVLTAVVGLIVGIIALARNSNRTRAIIGIVLSVVTLILAVIFAVVLANWYQNKNLGECFDSTRYPTQEAAQRCLERKLDGG